MGQFVLKEGLQETLRHINALRHSDSEGETQNYRAAMEEIVENLFRPSNHLAVYGSLAPGKPNHYMLAGVPGRWREGYVHGRLHEREWGSSLGFPGLIWQPEAAMVNVHLFKSAHLPGHWKRLDDFEGAGYRRSLVPVYEDDEIIAVANIYELRH